jgi:cytochrome c55X
MKTSAPISASLVAAALAVAWSVTAGAAGTGGARPDEHPAAVAVAVPDAARQSELLRLLRQDCGSCHGLRLTGGLGPPLTPQALRDKPAGSLAATIVAGRAGTAMPPWRPFLSETEAAWLVERLQNGDVHAR